MVFEVLVLNFPLSRAEHRWGGRIKARGLSEPRRSLGEGGVSFRVLRPPRRRAGYAGHGRLLLLSFSSTWKKMKKPST